MHYNRLYNLLCAAALLCCACASGEPREPVNRRASSVETIALTEINRQLTEREKDSIEVIIYRKDWKMDYHPEGYYSMIIAEGQGKKIMEGSTVELLCKVQLLDGTLCYEQQKRFFIVNKTNEIAGLHQGLINRRGGDKLRFVFPPHMAYGLLGDGDKIPPRAGLIFEVEILNID